jgi:hypothetical protein
MIVILNEVKNLIISTESITEILRLMPQNDITTQSLKGEEREDFLSSQEEDHSDYPPLQGEG